MAIRYVNTLRAARMQLVIDSIDDAGAPGHIEMYTDGYAVLIVTIPLLYPSFTQLNGIITLRGVPRQNNAIAAGVAVTARIRDSNLNVVAYDLSIGGVGSGADIEVNDTTIEIGQMVTITSGAIVHS